MSDKSKVLMVVAAMLLVAAVVLIPASTRTPPSDRYVMSAPDDMMPPEYQGVSLSAPEAVAGETPIVLTLYNGSDRTITFGHDLFDSVRIELLWKKVWYTVPVAEDVVFTAIAFALEPGQSHTFTYPQASFDPLIAGRFRAVLTYDLEGGGGPYAAQCGFDLS